MEKVWRAALLVRQVFALGAVDLSLDAVFVECAEEVIPAVQPRSSAW